MQSLLLEWIDRDERMNGRRYASCCAVVLTIGSMVAGCLGCAITIPFFIDKREWKPTEHEHRVLLGFMLGVSCLCVLSAIDMLLGLLLDNERANKQS